MNRTESTSASRPHQDREQRRTRPSKNEPFVKCSNEASAEYGVKRFVSSTQSSFVLNGSIEGGIWPLDSRKSLDFEARHLGEMSPAESDARTILSAMQRREQRNALRATKRKQHNAQRMISKVSESQHVKMGERIISKAESGSTKHMVAATVMSEKSEDGFTKLEYTAQVYLYPVM